MPNGLDGKVVVGQTKPPIPVDTEPLYFVYNMNYYFFFWKASMVLDWFLYLWVEGGKATINKRNKNV